MSKGNKAEGLSVARIIRGVNRLNPFNKPLYHSYEIFGVKKNRQISDAYVKNQKSKSPIITAYIALALAKCRNKIDDKVSFAEFFCADGYYTMLARHLGATVAHGYDNGRDPFFKTADKMRAKLGLDNVFFHKEDIFNVTAENEYDIVANLGGLYHVQDPIRAIDITYRLCRKYLIIQTVVSMENDDPEYFVTPAPHWTWGCRFSRSWLRNAIVAKGYHIVDEHFNELEGNENPISRGSSYFLIEKK